MVIDDRWNVKEHLARPTPFLHDLIRQIPSCVMKVDALDIDVGVEGVLVGGDCTTCVMGHVEAIREKLVVNVVRRFLQSNDMPPSCNLFEGIFFSRRGPGFQL